VLLRFPRLFIVATR